MDYVREDDSQLGRISFWALFFIFLGFTIYAVYATWFVLIKKRIGEDHNDDYMKMFYYSADATLLRKCQRD